MPNHILRCHTFVAMSNLNPASYDDMEDGDVHENPMDTQNTGSQVNLNVLEDDTNLDPDDTSHQPGDQTIGEAGQHDSTTGRSINTHPSFD